MGERAFLSTSHLQYEDISPTRLKRTVKGDELYASDRCEGQQVSVRPNLWGPTGQPRPQTEFLFEIIRLWQEGNASIGPYPVPQTPGFGHGLCVFSHDLIGCEESQNGYLREAAKKELLLIGLLEP
jgi:hypothetical protein